MLTMYNILGSIPSTHKNKKFKTQIAVSTECEPLLHHRKVEKSLSQMVISVGSPVYINGFDPNFASLEATTSN